MQLREIGQSGIKVAPLAFGGNVFGWTADERTSFALLDAFVAAGFNLIDTADTYSRWHAGNQGGESETIIGRWMKARKNRDRVIVATKLGADMGEGRKGLSAAYIARAVEDSLRRLGTDVIDLYQSHRDDDTTPMAETLGAYARLIEAGKVRAIGASNFTAARLAEALETSRALGLPRYHALQPRYSLYERASFEAELQPLCVKQRVGVINYYPLEAGFLTGKYRSPADFGKSLRGEDMQEKLNPRGLRILAALDAVGKRLNATPAQIAIAWVAARPAIAAPIASATSVKQFEELAEATRLDLDRDAVTALDSASA
ncbi:MAG: aldo/keto reductase [Alphaproteobacteria bacterium]|nr:aldo/keto reductase [Alphaproteobacteria bacterium]